MSDTFPISPYIVAREMVRRGIDPEKVKKEDFENWTDAFVDSVEFLYGLEKKVCEEVKTFKAR
jgi:hypothetical protein